MFYAAEILVRGKTDDAAADGIGDLCLSIAEIAMFFRVALSDRPIGSDFPIAFDRPVHAKCRASSLPVARTTGEKSSEAG
ncbi:MAG: hypothetical protein WDM70_09025 [Nitrosomonadales bacterium]